MLWEQLSEDIKTAMRSKEKNRLMTLRMLKSKLKDIMINEKKEISDEVFISVVTKSVKQIKDSIESYKSGGRDDLVEEEKIGLDILSDYLPEQLSEEEVEKIIKSIMVKNEISEKKDMGKAMKLIMVELKGKADGKLINKIVQSYLK
ncbi:GatB/YqeY domain-containing protein [Haliovirga abyssi]|uniref:Aspartyl-tRNA amidotransferase subunit B n=1 Tax=Haliovirga abyssi TaxID=2996794 RepID=A0AAU9D394_9FUSO|nr:GatB/YqeY domain-containing protein [Haliovirga abyssi]BDU50464.1 aspartyl-tRNA amidotransferase subunit B [Haliovirga abyssi]